MRYVGAFMLFPEAFSGTYRPSFLHEMAYHLAYIALKTALSARSEKFFEGRVKTKKIQKQNRQNMATNALKIFHFLVTMLSKIFLRFCNYL